MIVICVDDEHTLEYPYPNNLGYDAFCWVNDTLGTAAWQEYTLTKDGEVLERVLNPRYLDAATARALQ